MTFGVFTNIASTALRNIFTNMSPHPVSTPHRVSVIRISPGTLHPDHAGYSSSGPCRVSLIRISPGLPSSSSGPCRVSVIRISPGTLHPDHAGYSSSGSLRVCQPRSSGSVRVFLAGSGHPIPRDRNPNKEYFFGQFNSYLHQNGIRREFSCRCIPKQNSVTKRKNRLIVAGGEEHAKILLG